MNFFCPRCHQPITSQDASRASCPGCGMVLDLAMADTDMGRPLMPPTRDLTGQSIGRYQLEAWLGTGGMGTVYRATDSKSGETVALKLLAPLLCRQPDIVERFHREARALEGLAHPNIVGFREEGTDTAAGDAGHAGQHFIAMEYIAGDTLEAVLSQNAPLDPAQAVAIVGEIAAALAAAHHKGIVHRDLKPANVIVSPAGVKVLDFGIAHVTVGDMTLTHSDAILGTVNYMAPEQRIRAAKVDHRADIFSLGVIFYRSLTGDLPLGSFEPVSGMNPALDRRFDRVMTRMLHRDPERRYDDIAALLVDLAGLLRPLRRVPMAVAAGVVLVLALGGAAFAVVGPPAGEIGDLGQGQGGGEEAVLSKVNEAVERPGEETAGAGEPTPDDGPEARQALNPPEPAEAISTRRQKGKKQRARERGEGVGFTFDIESEETADQALAGKGTGPGKAGLKGGRGTRKPSKAPRPLNTAAPDDARNAKVDPPIPGAQPAESEGGGEGEAEPQVRPTTGKSEQLPAKKTSKKSKKKSSPKKGGSVPDIDGEAWAESKAEAAYYRVVNVGKGDQLFIRTKPLPEAGKVGAIPPAGRCVSFTGKKKSLGKGSSWWLIRYRKKLVGWVNAYYLAPEKPGYCKGASRITGL